MWTNILISAEALLQEHLQLYAEEKALFVLFRGSFDVLCARKCFGHLVKESVFWPFHAIWLKAIEVLVILEYQCQQCYNRICSCMWKKVCYAIWKVILVLFVKDNALWSFDANS